MLYEAYKAIETELAKITEIKLVDWFNDQYQGTIHTVPAAFVEFPAPLRFKTLRNGFQMAPFTVRIHTVSKALSDISKKIPDDLLTEHDELVESVFTGIHRLSANIENGKRIFDPLERTDLQHHQYISGWLMTTQDFTSNIYQHEELTTGVVKEVTINKEIE